MMMIFARIHDVYPREWLDRIFFLAVFVIGVGVTLYLKGADSNPWLSAICASIFIGVYAFLAYLIKRIKIEPETVGDNCYYLGFLFTLSSLAYTLYIVGNVSSGPDSTIDVAQIISGFGIAICSTIVGVVFRVIMMQIRVDFVAKDQEIRADVNKTMAKFRKTMSEALSRMKTFSAESVQLAAERDERIRVSTEKFLIDYQNELKNNSAMLATHMKEAFTDAAREAFSEVAREAVKEITSAVVENQKTFQTQMNLALDHIQASRIRMQEEEAKAFEEIQSRRNRMISDLEDVEKLLKDHAEFVANNRDFQNDINKGLEALRQNMQGILSQAKEFAEESVRIASERDMEIRKLTEEFMMDHRESLKNGANVFSSHMEEAFSKAAQKTMQNVSEAIAENHRAFQAQSNASLRQMQEVKNELQEQELKAYDEISLRRKHMAQSVKETEEILDTQKENITASSNAMREVTNTIVKNLIPAFVALERRTEVVLQANKKPRRSIWPWRR